jgi:hypothetical protein
MSHGIPRRCRECGCADDNACLTVFGPCTWVSKDLCSLCRDRITHSATLEAEIEEATHA